MILLIEQVQVFVEEAMRQAADVAVEGFPRVCVWSKISAPYARASFQFGVRWLAQGRFAKCRDTPESKHETVDLEP